MFEIYHSDPELSKGVYTCIDFAFQCMIFFWFWLLMSNFIE